MSRPVMASDVVIKSGKADADRLPGGMTPGARPDRLPGAVRDGADAAETRFPSVNQISLIGVEAISRVKYCWAGDKWLAYDGEEEPAEMSALARRRD